MQIAEEMMASAEESIASRYEIVRERVRRAAERAGRGGEEMTLIAVSKTHPAEMLRLAIDAGARDFGENRVQEAEEKVKELGRDVRWHLIGHLQANKARRAVQYFDVIHSLDSRELAVRLNRICAEENRAALPVMIQLDLGGEASKSGASETELLPLIETVRKCSHLQLAGLMTLPPYFEDEEQVRPFFRRLRELRDELQAQNAFTSGAGELSMGMSHDYEIAIEEGATMVRVGTAIFGARPQKT